MLTLSPSIRIYLCLQPTDMRRGFDRLAELAREAVDEDPLSGHLFVFRNRRADRLKVLYWDRNGFAVWYKRLERGRFLFPSNGDGRSMTLQPTAFQLLLGGVMKQTRVKATNLTMTA
jgi:transposase